MRWRPMARGRTAGVRRRRAFIGRCVTPARLTFAVPATAGRARRCERGGFAPLPAPTGGVWLRVLHRRSSPGCPRSGVTIGCWRWESGERGCSSVTGAVPDYRSCRGMQHSTRRRSLKPFGRRASRGSTSTVLSRFSVQTVALLQQGQWTAAGANALTSVALGVVACAAGYSAVLTLLR